jgi:hypothetical protein
MLGQTSRFKSQQVPPLPVNSNQSTNQSASSSSSSTPASIVIDGVTLQLNTTPNNQGSSQGVFVMFDKAKRATLTPDKQIEYTEKATKRILPGSQLISTEGYDSNKDNVLERMADEKHKIMKVVNYLIQMGASLGWLILTPKDVENCPDLEAETYDLLEQHRTVTLDQVVLSTLFYTIWSKDKFVLEDFAIQMQCLQNNVHHSLWTRCQEEIKGVHPLAQTGPVMLYIILRRMRDCSENTSFLLLDRLKNYKISDKDGEDIDLVF